MGILDQYARRQDQRRRAERLQQRCARGTSLLFRSARDLYLNDGLSWAGALAYYGLLSVFPLLLVAAAIAPAFVTPEWAAQRLTEALVGLALQEPQRVDAVVRHAFAYERGVGFGSILVLLWSGRLVVGTLAQALNLVSDVDQTTDSVLRRTVVEAVLLLLIGALFGLALASSFLVQRLWDVFRGVPDQRGVLVDVTSAAVRAVLVFGTYTLVYWFVPRGLREWRAVLVGAGIATLLVLVARSVFLAYARWSEQYYGLVYGPLAPTLILMVWAWVLALITLFGGSLASHVKVMVIQGQSAAEAEQRHVARVLVPEEAGDGRPRTEGP